MRDSNKGLLFGILAVTAFGLTLPATKSIVAYLHPVFIGLGRALFAAVFAALILIMLRPRLPNRTQLCQLALVAIGIVFGFPVLTAWAMLTVPASHGGVVLGILPMASTLAGVWFSRERPSTAFYMLSLIGAGLVIWFSLHDESGGFVIADLLLLAAIVLAGLGYGLGGHLAKSLGGWQVICWALVISAPLLIYPSYYYWPENLASLPNSAWLSFIYLSLVSQLFGFFLWYQAMALGGIARISQLQLLQPFVTLGASALLLSEVIEPSTFVFAVAVLACVALSKRMPIHQT